MKLMIASDLHGSAYFTSELLKRMEEEKPAKLILLGDILYHGPRNALPPAYDTKKTAELLNALKNKPMCVRGNCDGEVDQMVLHFPVLAEFSAVYTEGRSFYLSHGHHLNSAVSALSSGDILLYGHTHVPAYEKKDGILFVNPGSVSIPKEGSVNSYMIYEESVFTWKNVENGKAWKREEIK